MRVWPSNRLEPEHRIPLQEQFVKAVAIFKVLIALYLDTFICLSYGVVYAAFMSCALLGSVSSRLYQKHVMATRVICASSCACLVALVLAVFVIPSSPSDWSTYLFDILLLLFCLFEFAVGSYLPSMNKLQVPFYFIHFAICMVW
uniref:Uncharacterized protein n=1 Tax=Parascaris equorum TaxID=6256 RepID=A0A914RXE1_PAREQ